MITFEDIRNNPDIKVYITSADQSLEALGYTEHSFAHVTRVSETAAYILRHIGSDDRTVELARIAGYLHDIGNLVNRENHSQSGAIMAFRVLREIGMDAEETAVIVSAIGNHDEGSGEAVSPVAAALILGDKTDVRRSRVRNHDFASFDIHDRVNYSVEKSEVSVSDANDSLTLSLTIDTEISQVMDYFEIFLTRMIMCRKAAKSLGLRFKLVINGQRLL